MRPKTTTESPTSEFAETVPMPLPGVEDGPLDALAGLSLAPIEPTAYELKAVVQKDNRVCPQPTRWLEFYRILQERARGQRLPSPPLTGSAWAATPAAAKRQCFREQLDWAEANGCLPAAFEFLSSLPDSDWSYEH